MTGIEFEVLPGGVRTVVVDEPYDGSLLAVAERLLSKVRMHEWEFGTIAWVDEMEVNELRMAVDRERERARLVPELDECVCGHMRGYHHPYCHGNSAAGGSCGCTAFRAVTR